MTRHVALAILTTVSILSCFAAAGERAFEPVGLGGGGGILTPAVSPHDPKLMFCASDMSGVYRSADGGRSWTMLPYEQLASAIAGPIIFHPTDPKVCYVIPGPWGRLVLKISRDAGVTWTSAEGEPPWGLSTPQEVLLAISPDGKALLVGSDKGVFISADEGKTWKQAQGFAPAPAPPATTGPAPVGTPPAAAIVKPLAFYCQPDSPPRERGVSAAWFAATPDGVYRSGDHGGTWNRATAKGLDGKIIALCGGQDAKTGRIVLYVSTETCAEGGKLIGGLYRSDDRGETFVGAMGKGINASVGKQEGGQRETPLYPYLGMAENQTDTVFAFCYGNGSKPPHHQTVYRTDDGGKTWRATMYMRTEMAEHNVELSWLGYERGTGGRALGFAARATASDVVMWTDMMRIFLTDDGGKSWRQAFSRCVDPPPGPGKAWASIGLEMTTTWRFKFHPAEPKRAYICYTDIGFARSEDGGASRSLSPRGSPWTNTFYDVTFDPDQPNVLYAAAAYEHDIPSWKMSDKLYGGGGVCISTDYGRTWKPISKGLPDLGPCLAVVVDPTSPKDKRTLWCAFYGSGVFKSTDGGATWSKSSEGLKLDRNDHFTDLKRCADGTLYALCGGKKLARYQPAGIGGLFKSADGGKTWTDLTEKLGLWLAYGFDVHPDDADTLWIAASAIPRKHDEAGVYKSTDGGKSWTKLEVTWPKAEVNYLHGHYPSIDPKDPERVWLTSGTHGTIVTTDGGKTFRPVAGIPFRGATRITADPADRDTIWVCTFGGGVWKGPALGTAPKGE